MRTSEHAPRDPCRILERRHGLAEIVERGGGVLYNDTGATFRDLLEAVRRLEKLTLTAQRVLGRFHPIVGGIVGDLVLARAALRAPRRRQEPVSTAN